MDDKHKDFSEEEMEKYHEEARQKWGNTEAWKQSEIRVKKMGTEGLKKVLEDSVKLTEEIAECMTSGEGACSEYAQKLIARHYDGLRAFYESNPEMYRGLAEMYVSDERFKRNYEKVAKGLAEYMKEGMMEYSKKISNS